jgi:hypothetical protein
MSPSRLATECRRPDLPPNAAVRALPSSPAPRFSRRQTSPKLSWGRPSPGPAVGGRRPGSGIECRCPGCGGEYCRPGCAVLSDRRGAGLAARTRGAGEPAGWVHGRAAECAYRDRTSGNVLNSGNVLQTTTAAWRTLEPRWTCGYSPTGIRTWPGPIRDYRLGPAVGRRAVGRRAPAAAARRGSADPGRRAVDHARRGRSCVSLCRPACRGLVSMTSTRKRICRLAGAGHGGEREAGSDADTCWTGRAGSSLRVRPPGSGVTPADTDLQVILQSVSPHRWAFNR